MLVSLNNNSVLFKTHFSDKYDLIQTFKNVVTSTTIANDPVDFNATGFIKKDTSDFWHIDIPIGFSTDEAVPCFINGSYIGANHGHNGAVSLTVNDHGKDCSDIGSVWEDDEGIKFTLVRVMDCNTLHFISENIGKSVERYEFVKRITGTLKYKANGKNTSPITNTEEQHVTDLKRAIRHKKREIIAVTNGIPQLVSGTVECDCAKIYEEYEIINPATVAQDLSSKRPENGYTEPQDLGYYGEPMFLYKVIYQIDSSGALTIEFDHKKLMDIHFEKWMGAMYQEKIDVYGGGIVRFIPKTRPFSTPEGTFDFSTGVKLRGASFPENHQLEKSEWLSDAYPPDRLVDYFRDTNGIDKLALSCGYIPIYDGTPEKRKSISSCIHIYRTRKAYPTFLNGDVQDVHGVAYKKYFIPQNNDVSAYSIVQDKKTYIYIDFHSASSTSCKYDGTVSIFEKSEGISYTAENGCLSVNSDNNGYAVFICE